MIRPARQRYGPPNGLTSVKGTGPEPSDMIALAESATIPANAAGIVVGVLGIVLTAAWLAYLYR